MTDSDDSAKNPAPEATDTEGKADSEKAPAGKTLGPSDAKSTTGDIATLLWVAIWSALLSIGIGVGASVWEQVQAEAASRSILLLPVNESGELERERWLKTFLEEESMVSGQWLSPKSLVQQVSAEVPPDLWAQLFDESDAWLPWLLQLQPQDPFENVEAFKARLEAFRADPRFRFALYDEASLDSDFARYHRIRKGVFVAAGILFFLGVLALAFSRETARWRFDIPVGIMLACLLTGGAWFGLLRAGVPIHNQQGFRALVLAFGLAALVAPMLKGRVTQYLRRRDG